MMVMLCFINIDFDLENTPSSDSSGLLVIQCDSKQQRLILLINIGQHYFVSHSLLFNYKHGKKNTDQVEFVVLCLKTFVSIIETWIYIYINACSIYTGASKGHLFCPDCPGTKT